MTVITLDGPAYGTGQWLSPDQVAAMATAQGELETLHVKLSQAAYAVGSAFAGIDISGGSSSAALKGLVPTMRAALDKLRGAQARVNSGQMAFSAWVALANDYHRTMQLAIGDAAAWSLSGYATDVGLATLKDTGELAKDVADKVESAAKFGLPLIVAGLIALVILKVA